MQNPISGPNNTIASEFVIFKMQQPSPTLNAPALKLGKRWKWILLALALVPILVLGSYCFTFKATNPALLKENRQAKPRFCCSEKSPDTSGPACFFDFEGFWSSKRSFVRKGEANPCRQYASTPPASALSRVHQTFHDRSAPRRSHLRRKPYMKMRGFVFTGVSKT
ncbi:MAG: hypothetical protein AAFX53_15015 [Bacteroidota bacterium]